MPASDIPPETGAIQVTRNGGPEVITFTEIDTPVPKTDEVLVKVEWGGVNYS